MKILNTMEYDAWIIGNHDLEFGLEVLNKISKKSNADIFAANFISEKPNNFLKWKLYKKNGISAAVIGLTSPYIDEWLWGNKRNEYKLLPTIETIDSTMPEVLKAKPDIIILAIHHGRFPPHRIKGLNIRKIAEKFPQIDLILGGHSHQEFPGEKCGISSWYVETGCHAEKFAWIEATIDTENKRVIDIRSKLIPVKKKKIENPELNKSMEKWRKQTENFSKQKLGFTKKELIPPLKDELFAPINELFCRAIAESTGAEFAFHGYVKKSAKLADTITENDVFEIIPYEDTICTLELTPLELKQIIKEQISNKGKGSFQSPFGINIAITGNNEISVQQENGEKLHDDKKYLVAFNSYSLAGAGGRFPELKKIALLNTSKGKDSNVTVRDALRTYIKKHSPLDIKKVNRISWKK